MLEKVDVLVDIVEESEDFPAGEVAEMLLVTSNVDNLKQEASSKAS